MFELIRCFKCGNALHNEYRILQSIRARSPMMILGIKKCTAEELIDKNEVFQLAENMQLLLCCRDSLNNYKDQSRNIMGVKDHQNSA